MVQDADGNKVADLCGNSGEYGHEGLFSAFEEFCSAVQIGVDVLVGNAESTGNSLAEAAQNYVDSDDKANGELLGLADGVSGHERGSN
ncbi:hypothetical protein [Haloactinomyces albus]|uniref:Uncharacterized protein n=1 Tax=Haloactinomyces albus TaxID=1352928 RepID=A0AAE4CM84_9ACTN|nr:hypothetical protein [Haloactinomyces albus]MDR7302619.1 hypothetical protein [Haloactinomyces albus]